MTILDNTLLEPGLRTLRYECAGCGKAWRRQLDFRGLVTRPGPFNPYGLWEPEQLAQVIPLFERRS